MRSWRIQQLLGFERERFPHWLNINTRLVLYCCDLASNFLSRNWIPDSCKSAVLKRGEHMCAPGLRRGSQAADM